jgi:hypothetical protein
MLNHIIRLQAVIEVITNETARAFNLLAKQSTKMCHAIYQSLLALDNFLASEGRVYGKFNLSNFCLQINDDRKPIEETTDRMRKLTQVPIQIWKGWDPNDMFGEWFSALSGFKTLIGAIGLILKACLILPCLGSLMVRSIRTIMEAIIERKMSSHVMML